jgi:4-hydroxybenzoate polyprenyltransferase
VPNLVLFVMVVSAAFIVNQIFDIESDRLNRKTFLLSSGAVSKKEGIVVVVAVAASALGLSMRCDPDVRYAVWLGLVLGLAYSVPPLRLKGKPVLDMLANVVGFGVIGFAMGWLVYEGINRSLWVRCSAYALAMCGIFLNTCLPDEEGDRKVEDRTSCVVFGRQVVGVAILVFMCASVAAGILADEILCSLAVIGSLPAIVAVGVERSGTTSVVASQYAARLLLILVCVQAPLLGILSASAYLASRVYYRKRFGLRYPQLTGAAEIVPPSA